MNELLKCAIGKTLNAFCKLFNIVLNQGLYLVVGLRALFALFIKKGDANNQDNYRGITVLSCFGNYLLLYLIIELIVICEEQAGFERAIVLWTMF